MHIPMNIHHTFELDTTEGEFIQSKDIGIDIALDLR